MSVRRAAKQYIKAACLASGALRVAHRFGSPSAVILRYHSVQDDPDKFDLTIGCDSIHATPIFRQQMELLARRFNPVSLDDVLSFLQGDKKLPPRAVAVTFDDGYKDNAEIAAPILNHFGIPGTFYVLVDSVDRSRAPWYCGLRHTFLTSQNRRWKDPAGATRDLTSPEGRFKAFIAAAEFCSKSDVSAREQYVQDAANSLDPAPFPAESELMMTWDEVKSLARSGHSVGAHTMTHPNLAHVSAEEARSELTGSKSKLEDELGHKVRHFSYPHPALNPQWNATTLKLTIELGYATAVTTTCSAVWSASHPHILPRTYVPREESEFLWNIERTFFLRSRSAVAR